MRQPCVALERTTLNRYWAGTIEVTVQLCARCAVMVQPFAIQSPCETLEAAWFLGLRAVAILSEPW